MSTRDLEMEALQGEVARWKGIALYLADVHATTAEQEALTKSVSQSRKRRHFEICRKAVSLIEGNLTPSALRLRVEQEVLERLREVETHKY